MISDIMVAALLIATLSMVYRIWTNRAEFVEWIHKTKPVRTLSIILEGVSHFLSVMLLIFSLGEISIDGYTSIIIYRGVGYSSLFVLLVTTFNIIGVCFSSRGGRW